MMKAVRGSWLLGLGLLLACSPEGQADDDEALSIDETSAEIVSSEEIVPSKKSPSQTCAFTPGRGSLDACLRDRIEAARDANRSLSIRIAPGSYDFAESLVIYRTKNVRILGSTDIFGRPLTTLRMSDAARARAPEDVLGRYMIQLVDSQGFTLDRLILDGGQPAAQPGAFPVGAIAACPMNDGLLDVNVNRVTFSNFRGFTTLWGGVFGDNLTKYFLPITTPMVAGRKRLQDEMRANTQRGTCSGDMLRLKFDSNTVNMKSVGFYLVPTTAEMTHSIKVDVLTGTPPGSRDWLTVATEAAARTRDIAVVNNRFIVDLPAAEASQNSTYMHSAMKLHGTQGLRIEGNRFEDSGNCNAFDSGAAVNLAAGNFGVSIARNSFHFTAPACRSAIGVHSAIAVHAGFGMHVFYGVGNGSSDQALVAPVFGPSRDVDVRDNVFMNSRIKIDDACDSLVHPVGGTIPKDGPNAAPPHLYRLVTPSFGRFCKDLDAAPLDASGFPIDPRKDDGFTIGRNRVGDDTKFGAAGPVPAPMSAYTVLRSVVDGALLRTIEQETNGAVTIRDRVYLHPY